MQRKRTNPDLLGHRGTPTYSNPNIDQSKLSSTSTADLHVHIKDARHALQFFRTLVSNGLSEDQAHACLQDTVRSRIEQMRDPPDRL